MDFFCPSCSTLLEAQRLGTIRLWNCATCVGFAVSVPIVRKEVQTEAFRDIWQQLFSGDFRSGRPCPGCRKPLCELEAQGQSGLMEIDICRSCQLIWFDDKEFSDLPKVEPQVEQLDGASHTSQTSQTESRLLTPEELTIAAFKENLLSNRSLLFRLMDGSIAKKFEIDQFFGDFFNK